MTARRHHIGELYTRLVGCRVLLMDGMKAGGELRAERRRSSLTSFRHLRYKAGVAEFLLSTIAWDLYEFQSL